MSSSSAVCDSSNTLKRSWSRQNDQETSIPPLPKINGDVILEVFTHKSLGVVHVNEEYGDNERLSLLGSTFLDAVVTETLFKLKPTLKAHDIKVRRGRVLSDENIEGWIQMYRLREKLRYDPSAVSVLKSPDEARLLFTSYVGAVYVESGIETIRGWIGQLLLLEPRYRMVSPEPPTNPFRDSPPHKKIKNEQISVGAMLHLRAASPTRLQAPAQAFLPLFNQTASQRQVTVDYPAVFSGPPHSGRWIVTCIVNGIEKGVGTATSKQLAKEHAARNAYYAMGWAPLSSACP